MNLCITGGAGFIGSYFLKETLHASIFEKIVVYDALTYASDLKRLDDCDQNRFIFIKGDINDRLHFRRVLETYDITHVVHFAAETHVDRSIEGDSAFLQTNVVGTWAVVTETAEYWSKTGGYCGKRFIQISTDEVYGVTEMPAQEDDMLNPSNPYAASKAAADQYVLMRINFDGFPAVVVRSSNNFGWGQHPEKLIPKIAACLMANKSIPLYGDGRQKRCWLYAGDYSKVLLTLLLHTTPKSIYNVNGSEWVENRVIAETLCHAYADSFQKKPASIDFVKDRKGHDRFYNISSNRLKTEITEWRRLSIKVFLESYFKTK
jgi:dTDP-glucose 4,6-dehydratase